MTPYETDMALAAIWDKIERVNVKLSYNTSALLVRRAPGASDPA